MLKKSKKLISIFVICILFISHTSTLFAQDSLGTFQLSATILPVDATNLTAVDFAPGTGEVVLTWNRSLTSNISIQRIEIQGPQGPGINFTTKDLNVVVPDPGTLEGYADYPPFTNITGLTIGETYTIRIVSIAGTLESPGAPPEAQILFTPTPASPAPHLLTVTASLDTSTSTWNNGGIDDATLECRLTASLTDLNADPLGAVAKDSGWIPCPDSASTYNHTFTGLTYGSTYYYHVQTRTGGTGLSPYSNVISLLQPSSGGGGAGGGGFATCGDGTLDDLEQCDDGNRTSGDGCSSGCVIETGAISPVIEPPAPVCGNGTREDPEQCDDGNTTGGDGCSAVCLLEEPAECGNNVEEIGEGCDDGNLVDGDGCSSVCSVETLTPICGNGILEEDEQCDDGNYTNGDGCSFICEIEHAAAPEEVPEEVLPVCGNGILETPTEQCDDGNTMNDDGCTSTCQLEEIVNVTLEIRGAPELRKTNLPEDQRVTQSISTSRELSLSDTISQLGSADFFRINNTPNFGLISQLDIFKPSINNLDVIGVSLDNWGYAEIPVTMVAGTYDFGLNGEAHNTKVIKTVDITEDGQRIILDFTNNNTIKLIAGDTRDDNFVNALDIATMLASYKATGANLNDLNKDESPIVNAIDIAILIWNYKKAGETF
jgi:cysteine-rich repeat protein